MGPGLLFGILPVGLNTSFHLPQTWECVGNRCFTAWGWTGMEIVVDGMFLEIGNLYYFVTGNYEEGSAWKMVENG